MDIKARVQLVVELATQVRGCLGNCLGTKLHCMTVDGLLWETFWPCLSFFCSSVYCKLVRASLTG